MANILIADDSIVMRKNLKTIITGLGHNVVGEATNGQQAYILYNKEVDIVTMDITMPIMDGIGALKKIREKDPNAKVIMISALDQKKMVFEALENGAKYYIIKPVTEEKILNAINKVLSNDDKAEKALNSTEKIEAEEKIKVNIDPFTIDNKEGTFVVNINETLTMNNIGTLENALNGLMFIKPLKIVFNFGTQKNYFKDVLNSLVQLSKKVKQVQGEFKVSGEKEIEDMFL